MLKNREKDVANNKRKTEANPHRKAGATERKTEANHTGRLEQLDRERGIEKRQRRRWERRSW